MSRIEVVVGDGGETFRVAALHMEGVVVGLWLESTQIAGGGGGEPNRSLATSAPRDLQIQRRRCAIDELLDRRPRPIGAGDHLEIWGEEAWGSERDEFEAQASELAEGLESPAAGGVERS